MKDHFIENLQKKHKEKEESHNSEISLQKSQLITLENKYNTQIKMNKNLNLENKILME